jgi:hypothetical protein
MPGDYVWGNLIKTITYGNGMAVDSNPSAAVQTGYIIQYRDATFSDGASAPHHTSVIAAVGPQNRPTSVIEQNWAKNRFVTLRDFDWNMLTGGWLRVYKSVARSTSAGRFEYTIVNNTAASQTVTGSGTTPFTLTSVNTEGSFRYGYVTTGGERPTLSVNGASISIDDAAGYEIYPVTAGSSGIRQLFP